MIDETSPAITEKMWAAADAYWSNVGDAKPLTSQQEAAADMIGTIRQAA